MKKAFTAMEIIFVIVIIGILSGIAIPKLLVNRQDAEILKLKEQISLIKQGIKAYGQDKLYSEGKKSYPQSLCNEKAICNFGAGDNFIVLAKKEKVGKGTHWNGYSADSVYIFYPNIKDTKNGYTFKYDNAKGTFTCINYSQPVGNKLKCSDLGEN